MATISSPDQALARSRKQETQIFLTVIKPETLLSAQVNNGSIARGARTIAYDTGSGSAGNYARVTTGQKLEVTISGKVYWVTIKSITGSQTSGTITIRENGIPWADNAAIKIYNFWPPAPIPPRIAGGVFYKDYNLTYGSQSSPNTKSNPVCIAGPHQAKAMTSGSAVFNIPIGDSYTTASGASISSRSVTVTPASGSSVGSYSGGVIPVTITTSGQYTAACSVTDSNGKTQTTYRYLVAHDASYKPYFDFQVRRISGSWDTGGWSYSVEAFGDVSSTDFPDGTIAILWCKHKIAGTEDYVNIWGTTGQNILCSGYIRRDDSSDNLQTGTGRVTFTVVTPEQILSEMTLLGTVALESVSSPSKWYEAPSWQSVPWGIGHYLQWHTNALQIMDIFGLASNTTKVRRLNFNKSSVGQEIDNLAYSKGIRARLISDRLGRLHLVQDSQLLRDSARASLDTILTLDIADITGEIQTPREPQEKVSSVTLDGFSWSGSAGTPYVSLIPGYRESSVSYELPAFRGTAQQRISGQVLIDQTDANELAGRYFAAANNPWREFRLDHPAGFWGVFDIIPSLGFYEFGLADSDLKRGLPVNGTNLIARQIDINFRYNNNRFSGFAEVQVVYEAEAVGPAGIQGNYPTSWPTTPPRTPKIPVTYFDGVIANPGEVEGGDLGWYACPNGPTKYTGSRVITGGPAVMAFSTSYAAFIDSNNSTNTTNGRAVRLALSGPTLGTELQYDATNTSAGSPYIEKISASSALASWIYDYNSAGVLTLAVLDSSNPLVAGTALDLVDTTIENDISMTAVLDTGRAIAMLSNLITVWNIGISGTTLTDVAQLDMSTDTGGLAITRICKVSTTDGIVFVSGYNQTETLIEIQYITGTCSSSPPTAGVNEIDGEQDGVFPTAFSGSGYYQVVFTPVLIADDTIVSVWWKTVAGNYGNLYIKGLIDGTWYTLKSSIAQGSSLGRWESTSKLLSYSGQVLSAVQFGFSTSTGGHKFVMDGLRILDFYPALVTTKAWIVQTDGSSITAGDENTLDGVTTVLGSVNVSSTSVLIAYSDLLEDVPDTGLKLMVLSIDGTTVTTNAAYLLDEFGADDCSLIDFGNGSSFGVIYTIGTVQYFRTVSVSGTEITDNNDKILAISGGYTLGKNTSYVTDKIIVPLFYSPDNEGYYCIINNA